MSSRISNLLNSYSEPERHPKRQVNVRLDLESYTILGHLAEHFSVTRSALAGDLLEAAIADALEHIIGTLPSEEAHTFQAQIQTEYMHELHEEELSS